MYLLNNLQEKQFFLNLKKGCLNHHNTLIKLYKKYNYFKIWSSRITYFEITEV